MPDKRGLQLNIFLCTHKRYCGYSWVLMKMAFMSMYGVVKAAKFVQMMILGKVTFEKIKSYFLTMYLR